MDHLALHDHVRLRTYQKHQDKGQIRKVKINEDIGGALVEKQPESMLGLM